MKPGPKPRPTVKLIAAKAGLSGAAVSLALRDHPSIPPATRARIKRLADQLGYRVDPNVSRLMAYLRQRPQARRILFQVVNHELAEIAVFAADMRLGGDELDRAGSRQPHKPSGFSRRSRLGAEQVPA